MSPHERILVALDFPDRGEAVELARQLTGAVGGVKVGLELFISAGPEIIEELAAMGLGVFVDLKLHDIPNTVAGAARAVARRGATWMTVHALGGVDMMRRGAEAAAEGAAQTGHPSPQMLAVTVLTSHDERSLERLGLAGPCSVAVPRLARLAREAGIAGVVCSPLEIAAVREAHPQASIVVPGIRPTGYGRSDDQARTADPRTAVDEGATYLVIGRPITRAQDPLAAAEGIAAELARR